MEQMKKKKKKTIYVDSTILFMYSSDFDSFKLLSDSLKPWYESM